MIYLKLFLTFLQIGAVSFGGGYAMISLIREKALLYGWLNENELLNMIAVAESTPGPIAVNMATYVGSTQAGILEPLCQIKRRNDNSLFHAVTLGGKQRHRQSVF